MRGVKGGRASAEDGAKCIPKCIGAREDEKTARQNGALDDNDLD
jgi:hypothetical protein